jgi:hypothetical protein
MEERRAHAVEIQETGRRHDPLRAEIERRAAPFDEYEPIVRPGSAAPRVGEPVGR